MERVNYGVKSCCELIRDLYLLISWGKNLSRILSRSLCACVKHCLSIRMCTQCWTQKQDENSILCIVTEKLCKCIIQEHLQQSLQFMSCLCSCHWMFKLRTGYDDQDWWRKTNSRIEFWKSGHDSFKSKGSISRMASVLYFGHVLLPPWVSQQFALSLRWYINHGFQLILGIPGY